MLGGPGGRGKTEVFSMGPEPSCRAWELLGLKVGRPWEGHNISLCGHLPSADMSQYI